MKAAEWMGNNMTAAAIRLGGWAGGGFLTALCALDGCAPLAAGLAAAAPTGAAATAALAGMLPGFLLMADFGAGLRCAGIAVLAAAAVSAFRDTTWLRHPLFRPLSAAGAALIVELGRLLEAGGGLPDALRLAACAAMAGGACHYWALLLRETTLPRRKTSREAEWLRQRLRLSGEAIRALCESITSPTQGTEENPAVIFDRAAEVVCRGCALRELCWSKEYTATYNAFNDATPAILERGRAESGDFPAHFASRCIHFPQLVSAVNTEVNALLLRRQYRRQLAEERSRSRGQYAQLAELVAQTMCSTPLPPSPAAPLPHDVAMGSFPRQGQRMCGDSVTFFREGESRLFLLLSDGMGSGREARRESQLTVRLLEQFLTAGIDPKSALRTLNGALNLRSEDRGCFTTIDLADVDLTTGCARLYKYGAAPTYIKRMGSVRRLTGSSLPAGLQDTACVPAAIEIPLEENTFLLMISDGVADAGDDGWLQDLLAGWQGEDPHVLASQVLRLCRQRREADDDCSVLCLYLPRRGGGRREV